MDASANFSLLLQNKIYEGKKEKAHNGFMHLFVHHENTLSAASKAPLLLQIISCIKNIFVLTLSRFRSNLKPNRVGCF
jgi:putative heme iron utilization protein